MLCFAFYAYLYWNWNFPGDKYQLHFLVVVVMLGLLPLPFLEVGPLIGVFCVVPRAILSGLLLSDFFHLFWRKAINKPYVVEEEAVLREKV
jgi:hypothetical protein